MGERATRRDDNSRGKVQNVREYSSEDLQRDIAIELRVTGAVDLAHPAFADQRRDVVDAETGAGCESQTVELYGRDDDADGISPRTGYRLEIPVRADPGRSASAELPGD